MRSTESTDSGDDLDALFARVVSALTRGGSLFPPPFDLASAAALAANIDRSQIAERLFDVTAQRDTGYRVTIYATAEGVDDREVIDTTVDSSTLLVTLLDGLIEELLDRESEEGDPSGGQTNHYPADR